jgi:hypothetical protein
LAKGGWTLGEGVALPIVTLFVMGCLNAGMSLPWIRARTAHRNVNPVVSTFGASAAPQQNVQVKVR